MRDATRTLVSRRELIRTGSLVASGCALMPWGFAGASETQKTPGDADTGQSWTIGGDQIPSKRHELAPNNGGFECAAESPGANTENKKPPSGPRRKGQAAGKAAAKAALVRQYLTANAGRFSRRQLVEGCGDDWNDPKVRAAYNDALRRGLRDEVTKHPVDAEYSEITYSLKEVAG